jgi:hypothetical protein
MAIFSSSLIVGTSVVLDGIKYEIEAGKSSVMQKANSNRGTKKKTAAKATEAYSGSPSNPNGQSSAGFQTMDALIRSLDAQYDALPNEADWELYAANIENEWSLCANCRGDGSGKKLFRQFNFYRSLLGLGTITVPLDNEAIGPSGNCDASGIYTPLGGWVFPSGQFVVYGAPATMIAQVGLTLRNPLVTGITDEIGPFIPGTQEYSFWLAVVEAYWPTLPAEGMYSMTSTVCICDSLGTPGVSGPLGIDITVYS